MGIELYLAFVLAAAVLVIIPGPVVTTVIAESITYGIRPALFIVAGTAVASMIHLSIFALGLNSVMLILADSFEVLRWLGVAYLIYLGVKQWRATPDENIKAPKPKSARHLFLRGFLVNLTNPKVLLFYAAFFPQFIDPAQPAGPQLLVLCITFLTVATVLDSTYAVLAGTMGRKLTGPKGAKLRNRISGGLLISAGAGLALIKKS